MKLKVEGYEARSTVGTVELRESSDGNPIIRGMAALFDTLSENLGGFREVIMPGAFDETNMTDVRGLFNHNSDYVLGRTISNTLTLERTERGLRYNIEAPTTDTIRDLVVEPIRRGDVSQSSFGFIVGRGNDEWGENDEGVLIRTIHRIARLFDVSPVTFPAYAETSVATRSMENWRRQSHDEIIEQTEQRERVLQSMSRRAALDRIGHCQ